MEIKRNDCQQTAQEVSFVIRYVQVGKEARNEVANRKEKGQ